MVVVMTGRMTSGVVVAATAATHGADQASSSARGARGNKTDLVLYSARQASGSTAIAARTPNEACWVRSATFAVIGFDAAASGLGGGIIGWSIKEELIERVEGLPGVVLQIVCHGEVEGIGRRGGCMVWFLLFAMLFLVCV